MALPYLQSKCRKKCARSPFCTSSPPSSPRVLNPLTHETEWRRQHKETSQPPVNRTSQLQHLSSLLLRSMTCQVSSSVFMTTYISTHESADSRAVTSSDLHGMIIVPPRIQDDDVIEIDAKLENKHCCVFIWQMNFIRRKLKDCREPAFSFWEVNSVKVHNYHLL